MHEKTNLQHKMKTKKQWAFKKEQKKKNQFFLWFVQKQNANFFKRPITEVW